MSDERPPNEKSTHFWKTVRRVIGEFGAHRGQMVITVITLFIGTVLTIAAPYVFGLATDAVFAGYLSSKTSPGQSTAEAAAELQAGGQSDLAAVLDTMDVVPGAGMDFGLIGRLVMLGVAVYALSSLFTYIGGRVSIGVVNTVMSGMRTRVEAKLHRVPLSYSDRQRRGDVLSRLNNDLDNLTQVANENLQQIITSVITFVGVLAVMFTLSWQLALVAIAAIPLTAIIFALVGVPSQRQFKKQWTTTGELNAHVEESISGLSLLRVHGGLPTAREEFEKMNADVYSSSVRAQILSGSMMPAMLFVSNLVFVATAILGAALVAGGALTLGVVQAFVWYSRQFSQTFGQLGGMASRLQSAAASAERVYELLDAPEETPNADAEPFSPTAGRVEFDEVDFSYDPEAELIKGLSLTAEPGQTIAVVGPTGAGKTTVVNLLMRFYDVDSGAIRIDGRDVRDMSRTDLRRPIGMVLQDTWLFEGSIRDNIAYGNENADRQAIEAAAEAAYVDRFAKHLPDGLDSVITETADNISAGERQLITIARAFASEPTILILDEATSNVDTRTEVLVQEAMNRLQAGRTSFVIAHRLSTIRNADVIVVMNKGRIVEQGSHAELIASGGLYASLHAAGFEED
ncbi:putative ABC transporter ATP-binding protein [Brevibacterium ravenspurgense]|uniref:Fatty acid ABC transporter ATP-binding/permease protein n=1 Tax=Brevibacterium ravenspurgense TaxID=479117 RepID=A0A150H818_9MICO|nr:ABC transporter ATP-binding protein [Brevibacterium ravenspurgense]KXZ58145.1 putative ABC transporter ATP-binding protein [Brevibacterium ravenspurgense]